MEKLRKISFVLLVQIMISAFVLTATSAIAGPNGKKKEDGKVSKPTDQLETKEDLTPVVIEPIPAKKIPVQPTEAQIPNKPSATAIDSTTTEPAVESTVTEQPVAGQQTEDQKTVGNPTKQKNPNENLNVDNASAVSNDPAANMVPSSDKKGPCEDEALKNIVKILGESEPNVVGLLYEITALKLARQAKLESGKNKTIEDAADHHMEELKSQLAAMKNGAEIQARLTQAYQDYDLKVDLDALNKFGKNGVKPCYWSCKGSRFLNVHSSAYILALSESDQASPTEYKLSIADAAVVSAVEKIRSAAEMKDKGYAPGTEKGNLMQISNRVARYMGAIAGGEALTVAEMEERIAADSVYVQNAINAAYSKALSAYEDCLKKLHPDCAQCVSDSMSAFQKSLVPDSIKALLKQVAGTNSSNLRDLKGLTGVANDVKYDLRNFAKGDVPAYKCYSAMQKNPCNGKMQPCKDYSKTGVTPSQYTKLIYEQRKQQTVQGVKTDFTVQKAAQKTAVVEQSADSKQPESVKQEETATEPENKESKVIYENFLMKQKVLTTTTETIKKDSVQADQPVVQKSFDPNKIKVPVDQRNVDAAESVSVKPKEQELKLPMSGADTSGAKMKTAIPLAAPPVAPVDTMRAPADTIPSMVTNPLFKTTQDTFVQKALEDAKKSKADDQKNKEKQH